MRRHQDWEGLRVLWRGVKRLVAVLAMAFVGAVCVGFGSAVLTVFVYGIGAWIGLPVGLLLGGWLGTKIVPRDAALVFVLALLLSWIAYVISVPYMSESLFRFAVWGVAYLATSLVALGVGGGVPVRIRRPAAILATCGFGLFSAYAVVRHLWSSA